MHIKALFIVSFIFMTLPLTSVKAAEIVQCGVPTTVTIETENNEKYCDIHQRRLAYREESLKLKEQMHERAKNYAAPKTQALKQYAQDIEALNAIRGPE